MKNFEEIRQAKVSLAMQNENLSFGSLLRTVRKLLGITIGVASEDTGISYSQMRNLERDLYILEPKEDVIKKLTNYYGLPYDYAKFKIQERVKKVHDMRRGKIQH